MCSTDCSYAFMLIYQYDQTSLGYKYHNKNKHGLNIIRKKYDIWTGEMPPFNSITKNRFLGKIGFGVCGFELKSIETVLMILYYSFAIYFKKHQQQHVT